MSSGKGSTPPAWTEHLTNACENLEADFQGSAQYAFAYALYQTLRSKYSSLKIGVTEGFAQTALIHGDMALDHDGEIHKKSISKYRTLKHPRDICAVALASGQSQDQFDEDIAWAKQVIECAKDLYEEAMPLPSASKEARSNSLRI